MLGVVIAILGYDLYKTKNGPITFFKRGVGLWFLRGIVLAVLFSGGLAITPLI